MKVILFTWLFVTFILISFTTYSQSTYNWQGVTSSDWSNAANWRIGSASTAPATPPTSIDNVFIGVNSTFINQPQINSGYNPTVASVTMGTVKVVNLTVTGTLTVNGTILQKHDGAFGQSVAPTIAGTGTITCTNLQVGDATAPPLPFLGLTTQTYTTLLTSTVAHLNVNNNLNLNSTSSNATLVVINYNVNNPYFYLDGGAMTIGNSITTTNSTYVSTSSIKNLAEFHLNANTSAATLTLNGATPFVFDANGAGGVDFYTPGTFASTVIYNYSGAGTQTVYSSGQTRFGVLPASYQYIQFTGTGAKTIQSGTLSVGADWTSAGGKIDAVTNNTTASFQGTTQSLTDGSSDGGNGVTFNNAIFTGGGTKTLTSGKFNIATTGILTMASSSTLNANGNLTLFSNASSSAAVAVIPTGSSITNNVNVQRFLKGGNTKVSGVYTARGYRMLSSPVNYNGTAYFPLNYIGNTALTGGPGTGFTVVNNNPTIYLYREDVTPSNTTFNSGKHKGILNIKAGNIVTVFGSGDLQVPVGNGYIFYFVGNTSNTIAKTVLPFTAGPENTVITTTGRLNQGDVPVNLWYTPAGATGGTTNKLSYSTSLGATLAGYNMVGNPYASTLDLDDVITDNTASIGNTVYELYNVNPSQKYIAYSKGGSSDPNATRYVVSGQGFIVKAKGVNGSLTFHESQKEPTQQVIGTNLLMGMPVAEDAITGFYIKMERDSVVDDYCGIYFNSNASVNYDDDDAKDLDGASAQVYMSSFSADGVRTAINHFPDYRNGAEIKLYANSNATGLYKLKIEDIRNIDPLYEIWLKDNFTKDSLNLSLHPDYNFNVNKTDTTSFGANRFKLVIRRQPVPPYQLVGFTAEKVAEGIKISWKTYNEGNYTGFTLEKLNSEYTPVYDVQSNGSTIYSYIDKNPLVGTNTYRLKQNDINNAVSISNPVSVQLLDANSDQLLTVYPNPAVEQIKVHLNTAEPQASYKAKIYDYAGRMVIQSTMQNSNWSQNVGQLKPGSYVFELSKSTGEFVGRTKFIKKL